MGTLYCHSCGEEYKTHAFKPERDELRCDCGAMRSTFRKSAKDKAKPQKAISPASPGQRMKVDGVASIISAKGPCDPAHLWPRSKGGCDSADCVVPLTRSEHRAFDDGKLDLLPALIAGGFWVELGHMLTEHQVSPTRMLERLTGQRFGPIGPLEARVVELELELEAVLTGRRQRDTNA